MTIREILSLIFAGLLPRTFIACGSEDGQEPSRPDASDIIGEFDAALLNL